MLVEYTFFQHALIGALLASLLCAMIGTYVVTRRLVIAGGGVAHASLGGVGLGAYFGFSPLLGAAAFALFTGFGIEWLGRRREVREDSAIALLWTFGMSVGILFAYLAPGFMTELSSYLFGDVLSISTADLYAAGALTAVCTLFFGCFLRPIVTIAYDRDFARTQGLPVRAFETALTALTALTVVCCLQIVGIILVVALLSIPQLTAALFVRTFRGMIWLSGLCAYTACLGGLAMSYFFNVPSGASIIVVAVAQYLLLKILNGLLSRCFDKSARSAS